jgi:CRISPR type III-B/RAMP module RAMP protein Cmr6
MVPGSAVKGIAAHAAWQKWHDQEDEGNRRRIALPIAVVFGFPTSDEDLDDALGHQVPTLFDGSAGSLRMLAGSVAFLPALPADPTQVELVADIVNCHHPNYYGSKDPGRNAFDNEDPIPNVFPAVEAGADFVFILVALRRPLPSSVVSVPPPGFSAVACAKDWLQEGLTFWGAGAKTAAGYGWFEYGEAAERRREAQRLAAAQAERDAEARRREEERRRQEAAERKARLAAMTPDDLADLTVSAWNDPQFENRLRNFWKEKGGPSEPEKSAIVRALRSARLATWTELKQRGTRGEWARVVDSIRQHAKKMGPEKMPWCPGHAALSSSPPVSVPVPFRAAPGPAPLPSAANCAGGSAYSAARRNRRGRRSAACMVT